MAMTDVKPNYNFYVSEIDKKQVTVTNDLGRTVEHNELVLLDAWFGEVCEIDGIEDDASGNICIDSNRKIQTTQIDTSVTFADGDTIYFTPGDDSDAGTLTNASATGNVAVGMLTDKYESGTFIEFIPFVQRLSADGLVVTS